MKTAAGRFLFIFCLSTTSLWAVGPTGIETQKTGSTNPSTGLVGGGSATGGNSNLGSGNITAPQTSLTGPLGNTAASAPKVEVDKTMNAVSAAPNPIVTSQGQGPQPDITASPVIQPHAGFAIPGKAVPSQRGGEDVAPNAGRNLEAGVQAIRQGSAIEAAGMGEMAVGQALNRIFDASHASMPQGQGALGISGAQVSIEDRITKTVALANTSSPHNSPDLYVFAVKIAEDSLPAPVAGLVKSAVLDYASRKVLTALPELANQAYQSAAAGAVNEVRKAFGSLDKWEKLLGQPLVANRERLEVDVERVLNEGTKAAAGGRSFLAPRIWFTRAGLSFTAVLPAASVVQVPVELAESLALKDAMSAAPFYQQALGVFQARPSFANGFKLVYQINRGVGRSTVGSVYGAATYGFKALLARLWHAVRDFVLRLAGRAPAMAIGQGFSVTASSALLKPARSDTVSLAGAHLQVARIEVLLPSWQRRLQAVDALQTKHARAEALLSRETPLDMQAVRTLLGLAAAMAADHAVIMGEDSASAVARDLSSRLEQLAREGGLGSRSPLPAAMARLVSDPEGGSLRQWLDRVLESGQERILAISGEAQANLSLSRQDGGGPWALIDLGGQASTAKGRISGSGLRAAASLFLDAGTAPPQGSFIVMDRVLLGRWAGAQGRGKILAVLAPAALGGGIRILYENLAGVTAASDLLTGLGFAVEIRGQALSAALSAQVSDAGGAALAATLSRVVNVLQTGRKSGPAVSGTAHGQAASAVRKLLSDLKSQKAAAAAVAQVLQSVAPEAMRLVTIGRVEGLWAQSGRLTLDDGRSLAVTLLKDPESGLFTAARAEISGPGEKPRALAAAELGVFLSGE